MHSNFPSDLKKTTVGVESWSTTSTRCSVKILPTYYKTELPVPTQDATIDPHLAMTIEIGTTAMIMETDIDLAD